MARQTAASLIPPDFTRQTLHDSAAGCRACGLMFVGEQPGNEEDHAGRPFVGPAVRLPDAALEEAGIDRARAYVTNVVKHFKWMRAKPNAAEIAACVPWLTAERGKWVDSTLAPYCTATVHPSSILRARDAETRRAETARFIADLRPVAQALRLETRKAR
jgi:DNA polymerase